MLDQVPPPGAKGLCVGQQLAHHVELVKARENLLRRLLLSALVRFLDQLRESAGRTELSRYCATPAGPSGAVILWKWRIAEVTLRRHS
ncbi:hypothetical protein [Tabrizicola sp.]|uniref:hypothetical protein n=1 Tax=Tabrizicola sp. TaxID=2005166 RepID=UPI001A5D2AE8|nr:hypothetical protein [Tabrizicola sp.]MBL9074049.1 hypothetical protein [Tabrizicola sp.]